MADANLELAVIDRVLALYDRLPTCGKPRDDEYTVLAAIVAEHDQSSRFVVALATGTKCIGSDCENGKGCLLSDSHGEILAKRTFSRYIGDWVIALLEKPALAADTNCPLQWNAKDEGIKARLSIKDSWKLHMYISDCPCGDASIYASDLITVDGVNPTGAKLVQRNDGEATTNEEKPGSLRTKSGRSDIKVESRTTSMSCSDKVCRWSFLGLQGAMLSLWIEPVHLRSLIVDQDPSTTEAEQKRALVRALHSRVYEVTPSVNNVINEKRASKICAPDVFIAPVESAFTHGKAAAKHAHPIVQNTTALTETDSAGDGAETSSNKRRKRNPLSPCGASLNWYLSSPATHRTLNATSTAPSADPSRPSKPRKISEVAGGTVEVTIAHTGALQGSVKKSVGEVSSASRLSPYAMRTLFEHTLTMLEAHRHDSELHEKMYDEIACTLTLAPVAVTSSAPLPSDTPATLTDRVDSSPAAISTAGYSTTESGECLLSQVQRLTRRELKTRCGNCYYNTAKEQFLCHPVFKDWICDE